MGKRSIKKDGKSVLARKSIEYLFEMARHYPEHSQVLIRHAIAYKKRHKTSFSWEQKRSYCNKCLRAYDNGEKVRATSIGLIIICHHCGHRRMLRHPQKK